jgi:hypothetical protein
MAADLERIFRDTGLAEALQPRQSLELQEAVRRVVDPTGKILPPAANPFRTPRFIDFDVGTTRKRRVGRAGTLTLASVTCDTAPSTGDATITITVTSELEGAESYVVTVPQGETDTDHTMAVPVNASDKIAMAVTSAEGASGVSATLTVNLGG